MTKQSHWRWKIELKNQKFLVDTSKVSTCADR